MEEVESDAVRQCGTRGSTASLSTSVLRIGNVAAGLIAYTWHEKKPSLNIRVKEPFLISN